MAKDYYQILGIERNSSKEEIKKAFHKLAHQHHPDKRGGNEAKFKEINEAYQILSDEGKRSQYDTYGQNFAGGGGGGGFGGFNPEDFGFSAQGGPTSGRDFSGFTKGAGGGMEFDLGDLFGNIFGGGGRAKRGRDISVDIQINFSESIFGTERQVLIHKVGACDTCRGSGAAVGSKEKTCSTCGGKGKLHESRQTILGAVSTTRTCDNCHGRGQVPEKACPTCQGLGIMRKNEEIKIAIPVGIENGEMIRLSGQGEALTAGQSGDLYVKVHVEPHKIFRREGVNLLMDLNIKLSEALLGGEREVETLDGKLTLKIPEGISAGEILRLRDRGVPAGRGRRGDLYVKVIIKTPQKLSKKARQIIDELKKEGL